MTPPDGRLPDLEGPGAAERLAAAGLSPTRAGEVHRQLLACARTLRRLGVREDVPAHAFVVPGRIEVLGKHTDYAGGRSLLAAAERGFTVVAVPRDDRSVRVLDVVGGEEVRVALDAALEPAEGWARYPASAARRLARNFPAARTGADIAFSSDLPVAAGMSSSSALIVAVCLALAAVNRLEEDERHGHLFRSPEELAGYLAAVENGQSFGALEGDLGVGTRGGSEDHTAMLCARAGRLVQYAFAPVRFERSVAVPPGHRFVIAASGVRAEKTGAARARYNRAAELMRTAAELWRVETGRADDTIGAALDATPEAASLLRAIITTVPLSRPLTSAPLSRLLAAPASELERDALLARVEQFVAEDTEIIPDAGDALARGDLAEFGRLVDRSQALACRLLGNQVDETVHLARSAREAGAEAACSFGAGFGGSVWALVADATADHFGERWRADFMARFPERAADAHFFQTQAGPPAARVL